MIFIQQYKGNEVFSEEPQVAPKKAGLEPDYPQRSAYLCSALFLSKTSRMMTGSLLTFAENGVYGVCKNCKNVWQK